MGVEPSKDRDQFRGKGMECGIIYEKEMSHRSFGKFK